MYNVILRIVSCALLFIAVFATHVTAQESGTVQQIIDGDTVVVRVLGKKEHVRLIGIDAPESRDNQRARRAAEREGRDLETILSYGKRSSEYLRRIVPPGTAVRVVLDVEHRDHYGRLLAYLYSDQGGDMINERMIRDGYAYPLTVPPNVAHAKRFKELYQQARSRRSGLWGD